MHLEIAGTNTGAFAKAAIFQPDLGLILRTRSRRVAQAHSEHSAYQSS
jgi:hypothetical protein